MFEVEHVQIILPEATSQKKKHVVRYVF